MNYIGISMTSCDAVRTMLYGGSVTNIRYRGLGQASHPLGTLLGLGACGCQIQLLFTLHYHEDIAGAALDLCCLGTTRSRFPCHVVVLILADTTTD